MLLCVNDPSAGSPTETLLRLLHSLSDMVYLIFQTTRSNPVQKVHQITQSRGVTGGVYKGQGHNLGTLMTCLY